VKKIGKLSALTVAAALAVSGGIAVASPASATTAVSPACTAAMQTYNQDVANLKTLQDQVNANLQGGTLAAKAVAYAEAKSASIETNLEQLAGALLTKGKLKAIAKLQVSLAVQLLSLTGADLSLAYFDSQLEMLKGRVSAAQYAAEKAQEAEASACQDSGSDSPAPTGSPAPSPSGTPTMDGSTQQYYQNGASFVLLDDGIILTGGGSVQADCAETAADPGADNTGNSGAGRAGNFPQDTGPTVADQTAWISGCVAQENAYPVSVLPSATPAATTPAATGSPTPAATGSPTPAATASPVGSPNS